MRQRLIFWFLLSSRERDKTVERQDRGYPSALARRVVLVGPDEWVSQFDAAAALEVSMFRIGLLVTNRKLTPVQNAQGQAGVSLDSVERERLRRSGVGALQKGALLVGDLALTLRSVGP